MSEAMTSEVFSLFFFISSKLLLVFSIFSHFFLYVVFLSMKMFLFRWTDQNWSLSNERTPAALGIECQIRFEVDFWFHFFPISSHDLSQTTNKALWMSIVMIELYFVRQKRKNQLNSMFRRACISSILIESSKVNKVNKKKFLIRHRRSTSTTHKESERNKTPSHIRIIIISVWLCVRAIESMCLFWWVCDVDTWPIDNRGLDDPQTKWTQEIKYIGPNLICIWQLDSR